MCTDRQAAVRVNLLRADRIGASQRGNRQVCLRPTKAESEEGGILRRTRAPNGRAQPLGCKYH